MNLFSLVVFIHLFSAVLLTGSVLFWVVMAKALGQKFDLAAAEGHLSTIGRGRWPPMVVPESLRFSLVVWAGLFTLILMGSGVLLLELLVESPSLGLEDASFGSWFDKMLHVKFILSGMLITGLVALARSPRPWLIYFNGATLFLIVVLSALLGR